MATISRQSWLQRSLCLDQQLAEDIQELCEARHEIWSVVVRGLLRQAVTDLRNRELAPERPAARSGKRSKNLTTSGRREAVA